MNTTLQWIALLVFAVFVVWRLLKQSNLSTKQRNVKFLLNALLFVVLFLFILQPKWSQSPLEKGVLVYGKGVNYKVLKDSLKLDKAVTYTDFKSDFDDYSFNKIYLAGQDFEPDLLSRLAGKDVQWIPVFPKNVLQEISWDGTLNRGDLQQVSGKIDLSEKSTLKLVYADKTLDSLVLDKGFQSFKLSFSAFSEGRIEAVLKLGNETLETIRFFAKPRPNTSVVMLLDNPDFESKVLAEWLGTQGFSVDIQTEVAKQTLHQTQINKSEAKNLVITTPDKAGDASVRKALANGNSILLYGLVNNDLSAVNKALGTGFSLKRISEAENIKVDKELTSLPFTFNPKSNQRNTQTFAFQNVGGKVGVSLLNETFPLKLSGDSVTYSSVWSEMINSLTLPDSNFVYFKAPVYKDVVSKIIALNYEPEELLLSKDTVALQTSPVNAQKKNTEYFFKNTGWQDEVYVYENPNAYLLQWLKANSENRTHVALKTSEQTLPDWLWFLLIVLCLTALWVEPKIKYGGEK